jgi:hypothetical protein
MKLTKDEAWMLYLAIDEYKFENSEHNKILFNALNELQGRLNDASTDKRRQGRTSQNSTADVKKRFVNTFRKKFKL